MVTPNMGNRLPPGQMWAADNGRFSAPEKYTDAGYLLWLGTRYAESCLFATAPDVVGDAAATLALSAPMFDTTAWKLGEACRVIVAEAKRRGVWVHMGRVNSLKRMRYAESIGCDSADGTVLKHDPKRPVHAWGPRVLSEPSLWRPS
jgi:hypothetical protein